MTTFEGPAMTDPLVLGNLLSQIGRANDATRSAYEWRDHAKSLEAEVEKLVDLHAMSSSSAYYWLSVILVSFVIGGLREELWRSSFLAGLRSIWPRAFGSQGGAIGGAAIAALFFDVGHIPQGMLAAALITVVGFLLGVIMTAHRSVWPSVVAHGFFDAASLALLPWAMQQMQELQKIQHLGG